MFKKLSYSKFIRVTLNRLDLMKVRFLADVLARGAVVRHSHVLGAAGQVLVAKAFPELRLNGRFYLEGDGGYDYLNARFNTKTTVKCADYLPILWCERTILSGEKKGALVYIGVAMDPYEESSETWSGEIYGFATIFHLRRLLQKKKFVASQYLPSLVGFPSCYLYPPSWLKAYLKFRDTTPELLEEFFSKEDLIALNEALFTTKFSLSASSADEVCIL